MKHAVYLTLDAVTAEIIEDIANRIADIHPSHRPEGSEIRPHITLGACDDLDIERCEAILSGLSEMIATPPLTCHFGSLGTFGTDPAVLFVAPVVTAGLLELHAWFHEQFAPIASQQSAFYLPGRWVPHCTLAERLPIALLSEAMHIASTIRLPLLATVAAIEIVDIPSARILATYRPGNRPIAGAPLTREA